MNKQQKNKNKQKRESQEFPKEFLPPLSINKFNLLYFLKSEFNNAFNTT